jgi:hypothetical protein
MPWRSNPLLLWAVGIELLVLAAMLLIPPVADLLGHGLPPLSGLLVAVCAVPAVVMADAALKALRGLRHSGAPRRA